MQYIFLCVHMDIKQWETHDYIIISSSFHGHVQNYDKMPNLEVPSLFVVFSLPHNFWDTNLTMRDKIVHLGTIIRLKKLTASIFVYLSFYLFTIITPCIVFMKYHLRQAWSYR